MAFSENLKYVRIRAGLSQAELAQALGLTQVSISDFERGKKLPAIDTAVKIEKVLGITCREMVESDFTKSNA